MNILYYIPGIGQEMGGLRQYAVALLKILAADTENQYFVLHDRDDPEIMAVLKDNPVVSLVRTPKSSRITLYKNRLSGVYARVAGRSISPNFLDEVCKKHNIKIIHCPYQFLPESKFARSICTMHDVQELHFPEYFTPEDRADRAVAYLKYIKNADKIIVSYRHIKEDIIRYFNVSADRIAVCLLDMGNLWIDKFSPSDVISLVHLNIPSKFILYPANTWAHKNHLKLLEALALVKAQGLTDLKVVCTGHKTPYFDDVLKPFIEKEGLADQGIFTGVVNEKELYSAYKTCVGVVVPTLYEAGSFPVMESILLDVPVICSNVTSLPETIGNDAFVFDPTNAKAINEMMIRLWSDEKYREMSVANCKKQSPKLRKTGALDIMKGVYNELKTVN